jgi:hypothetical protein
MLIPDRLWTQMTETEQQLVQETMAGLRRGGRDVACPHCAKTIRIVTTHAAIGKPDAALDHPAPPAPEPKPVVRSKEQLVLEAARMSGLLASFIATVTAEKQHGGVPSDMDAFFLLFFRTAQPIKVSAILLASWKQEFGGFIEVWQGNGIVAVLSDGELRTFVPNRLTQPTPLPGPGQRLTISNTASYERWVKGKFGYVPAGARNFGTALRQAHTGNFGAIVQ